MIRTRPTDAFDAAMTAAQVNSERGAVYGHPRDTFRRIAALLAVVAECPDEKVRVALGAIATKMARIIESPRHVDSWVDIAGYARTGVMLMEDAS